MIINLTRASKNSKIHKVHTYFLGEKRQKPPEHQNEETHVFEGGHKGRINPI